MSVGSWETRLPVTAAARMASRRRLRSCLTVRSPASPASSLEKASSIAVTIRSCSGQWWNSHRGLAKVADVHPLDGNTSGDFRKEGLGRRALQVLLDVRSLDSHRRDPCRVLRDVSAGQLVRHGSHTAVGPTNRDEQVPTYEAGALVLVVDLRRRSVQRSEVDSLVPDVLHLHIRDSVLKIGPRLQDPVADGSIRVVELVERGLRPPFRQSRHATNSSMSSSRSGASWPAKAVLARP